MDPRSITDSVKKWGAKRVLRRLHRIFHRMPIKLREVTPSTVLVVAPHMDDELIGPGGTLLLHRDLGSDLHVVFCAKGADSKTDATRKKEAHAVSERLGSLDTRFLDFPDGMLSPREGALSDALRKVVNEVRPTVVFCPFPADHHRDHSAASMALARALADTSSLPEVWTYEVWSPLWPNVSVDISRVADEKGALIGMYQSQTDGLHYVEGTLGLNRYRGLKVYVPYAEAFFVSNAAEFRDFAADLDLF